MTAPAPALAADLVQGLRRLKLARIRAIAPELCQTAKTQRWAPDEFLRTLIEAEIAARDESNLQNRIKFAGFPVRKTLDDFKVQASSVPQATFDYLCGLEWVRAKENLCLVGPAGTGKSHLLVGLGYAAAVAGHRVRYFAAADLVETLYRGLADNSVGRVIDGILRADLVLLDELGFAPLDPTGGQLLFRFVSTAYERHSLGVASHWPFNDWFHFLPDQTTAVALIDRLLHHSVVVATPGESFRYVGGTGPLLRSPTGHSRQAALGAPSMTANAVGNDSRYGSCPVCGRDVVSRNPHSGQAAARSYSWISPPRRSCRTIGPPPAASQRAGRSASTPP